MRGVIGLIAFDLDGTVLSRTAGDISDRTVQALKNARRRGASLLAATGRPASLIPDRVMKIGRPMYIVASNGAVVLSPAGNELFRSTIDMGKALGTMELAKKRKAAFIANCREGVVTDRDVLLCLDTGTNRLRQAWVDQLKAGAKIVDCVPDFLEKSGWAVEMLSCIQRGDLDWSGMGAEISDAFGLLSLRVSGNEINITNRGVGKDIGIAVAANAIKVEKSKILAFGDGENDVCMRRSAGVLVAMGNSAKSLLECADFVTGSSDEDGVADFLERCVI